MNVMPDKKLNSKAGHARAAENFLYPALNQIRRRARTLQANLENLVPELGRRINLLMGIVPRDFAGTDEYAAVKEAFKAVKALQCTEVLKEIESAKGVVGRGPSGAKSRKYL